MKVFKIYLIIVISLLFALTINSHAQDLNNYLISAAENNPGLKWRFKEYQASLLRVPQVGSLPDPEVSFGYFIEPMERYIGKQVAEISIMQMFPWYGTLGSARNEASLMAKAKYEEFNEAKSLLFYEVKATWYGIYLIRKEIDITEENIKILRTLEEVAVTRYTTSATDGNSIPGNREMKVEKKNESTGSSGGMGGMNKQQTTGRPQSQMSSGMSEMPSGGSSMIDVIRIQLEINELNNSLSILNTELHHLIIQFNNLLNRNLNLKVIVPDTLLPSDLPVPVSQIPDSIKQNNQMLKMLEQEEKAFLAQERMNRQMGFPMIGIGLQYNIFKPRHDSESMMNGKNMLMPMATFTIPLWRRKYSSSIRESVMLREAVSERNVETYNELIVTYEEGIKDYEEAARRINLYRQQTVLGERILRILIVQYTTAGSDFEEVLRMQEQLLNYKLQLLNAVVDQNVSVAMLERLMGR